LNIRFETRDEQGRELKVVAKLTAADHAAASLARRHASSDISGLFSS
jgi:hypothetical protein